MTISASGYVREPNELYETEPWVTRALLRRFPPLRGRNIWEPAAGNHKIADVLLWEGANVFTSDIVEYDKKHDTILDFMKPMAGMSAYDIITNPPYGPGNRIAAQFARLALQRTEGWIALLLTAKFDFGKARRDLFADNPRFAFKIALTDRIQWFPGENSGTEDHCWLVWGPRNMLLTTPVLYYEGK